MSELKENPVVEIANCNGEPPSEAGDDLLTRISEEFPDCHENENPGFLNENLLDDQTDADVYA